MSSEPSVSMEICNEDFLTDGDTPGLNFKETMEAGQRYLDSLGADSLLPQLEIHGVCVSPEYLSVMANSDIGFGTDPERSEVNILNNKERVLVSRIFPTLLFHPGKPKLFEKVHTITEESQLSKGNRMNFGIAGGFEGVQLGFEKVTARSDWSHERRVIAIADLRYQWATTESRIRSDKLYKFLTKDCKDALGKINGHGEVDSELHGELSRFIEKYGTHVVLKCTHGYRMEKVERWDVSSAKSLEIRKAGMLASVSDYGGFAAEYLKHALADAERTESYLGVKSIGSKEHMNKAFEGGIDFDGMMQYSGKQGDAGVISHDQNMMIAEMLLAKDSPYKRAGERLRYWTKVRVNDLKLGWGEGLFATSYQLKFFPIHTDAGRMKRKSGKVCEHSLAGKNGVRVTIGDLEFVHEHPGNDDTECLGSRVTNVHTNDAKSVHVSVLDDKVKLQDVLSEIIVFRRFVAGDGVKGLVLASTINTSFITGSSICVSEIGVELFDFQGTKGIIRTEEVTIGSARAKVCRQN